MILILMFDGNINSCVILCTPLRSSSLPCCEDETFIIYLFFTFSESAQLTRFVTPAVRLDSILLELRLPPPAILLPRVRRLLRRHELQPLLIETTKTVDLFQEGVLRLVLGRNTETERERERMIKQDQLVYSELKSLFRGTVRLKIRQTQQKANVSDSDFRIPEEEPF